MKTVTYHRTRLFFDANIIEALDWDDQFRVVTPEGTFQMTKRDFYDTFGHVVKTRSYRQKRCYHYPTTPEKAMQYLTKKQP